MGAENRAGTVKVIFVRQRTGGRTADLLLRNRSVGVVVWDRQEYPLPRGQRHRDQHQTDTEIRSHTTMIGTHGLPVKPVEGFSYDAGHGNF